MLAAGLTVSLSAAPGLAADLQLPAPVASAPALPGIGLLPERLLTSQVPGPASGTERVEVAVAGDGSPAAVVLEQRLVLTGTGDYVVRERGPARAAQALDDTTAPILRRGTVVWQGFVPGRRELAARLTLDAGLETARLPLAVSLMAVAADGAPVALPLGAALPPGGRVTVTLRNQTGGTQSLPTAVALAPVLAPLLDELLASAVAPTAAGGPPPAVGRGLPASLPAEQDGLGEAEVVAPLRISGTVRVPGAAATVTGPGLSALPDGAEVSGVLAGEVSFEVAVPPSGGVLDLKLDVSPALDPRVLAPPAGAASWAAWATAGPDAGQRRAATDLVVSVAAAGARAAAYTPYLGADIGGNITTTFVYAVAPPPVAQIATAPPELNRGAVALVGVAVLVLAANVVALWRLS